MFYLILAVYSFEMKFFLSDFCQGLSKNDLTPILKFFDSLSLPFLSQLCFKTLSNFHFTREFLEMTSFVGSPNLDCLHHSMVCTKPKHFTWQVTQKNFFRAQEAINTLKDICTLDQYGWWHSRMGSINSAFSW